MKTAVSIPDEIFEDAERLARRTRKSRSRLFSERMVISQGDIWWAVLPDYPVGSGPGFRRPLVVVQSDALNRSRTATIVCVPLTSNLKWALAPGNLRLPPRQTGLPKESVANVSQIIALDRFVLKTRVGKLSHSKLDLILSGINLVLGK